MARPTEDDENQPASTLTGEEAPCPDSAEKSGQGAVQRRAALSLPARKGGRTVLLSVAAACAVALVVGVVAASGGSSIESDRGQTFPELLACSTVIVEGTLKDVRPAGEGHVQVTMSVDRWLKPRNGVVTVTFDLADPAVSDPVEAYREGDHVLMLVPSNRDHLATTFPFQGQEIPATRDRVIRTLPGVANAECPDDFR
ncbi:hypothetical protein ACIQRK_20875 [Streptomyces anulatus]